MPHGLPDPISGSRQHFEDDVALDAGLTLVVDAVGERKRVLDLGCGSGRLARALALRECDVVGFDSNPVAVEEARKYCTHAGVADLDVTPLDELLGEDRFDVIVVADVLQHLRAPIGLLDRARSLLLEGGYLVALVPNAAYGASRLAMIDGSAGDGEWDGSRAGFTAKSLDELFLGAGYRVEPFQRTQRPIFDDANALSVDPSDFDPALLGEIERQPEAQTLQFVVRAQPLSNDARYRAVSKRFIAANTQLSTASSRLQRREREIEHLAAQAVARESELTQVRLRLAETETDARQARAALAELNEASRNGAATIARATEYEARARSAEARLREVEAQAAELLERAHRAELDAVRYGERLAVYAENGIAQRTGDSAALDARLVEAEAQSAQARVALEAERAGLATKLAEAKAEFESVLATLRRSAEETEYGYAVRVADLELERDTLKASVDERAAADVEQATRLAQEHAAHQTRLHELGTEIQGLQQTIVAARGRIATLDALAGQLQGRVDDTVVERDELRIERDQLRIERDQLRVERDAENAALDATRVKLENAVAALDVLTHERDSLKWHVEKAQLDLERFRTNLETVMGERDGLRDERDGLRAERDAESAALDATRAKFEDAVSSLDALAIERDALVSNLETAASDLDDERAKTAALDAKLGDLERNLQAARADFATVVEERTRLKGELDQTRDRFAKAHDDFITLEGERDQHKTALFASRDALVEARTQAGEFRALFDLASKDLAAAERDRAGYVDLLAVADAEIAEIGARLTDLQTTHRESARAAAAELAVLNGRLDAAAKAENGLVERLKSTRADLAGARAEAAFEREAAVESSARIAIFEAETTALEARLTRVESQRNEIQRERDDLKQLQQELQAQVQSGVEMWKAAIRAADERRTEVEKALLESRKENETLKTRVDEAAKRTVEMERRFADYVHGAIDQTRAEMERTALLIDTVQGSVFWKVKRWLSFRRSG